jgi:membrane protease YdiL (CAAX protease family)
MDSLLSTLTFAALSFVVILFTKPLDKRMTLALVAAAALYLGLDDFVTGLPRLIPALDLVGGRWNWMGKILSLCLAVLTIVLLRMQPSTLGLTLRLKHPKLAFFAILAFIVWGSTLGLLFKPGAPSLETLWFQSTMPGLSEELVYRGIVPALLMGLVWGRVEADRMPWAVIISTAVAFGLWHGISVTKGQFEFELLSALFPMIGSIPGGWLRFKTGSLLLPVLGHSLANLAFHLAGGMVA